MKTLAKYILVSGLSISWFFLFLMIFGEETTNSNLNLFWLIKIVACVIAPLLYKFTSFCYKQGFFPELVNEFIKKTAKE